MSQSNMKGFTPITGKQVESILGLLAKAQASLGETNVLSTPARRKILKLRRGAQQVIPTIAVLASKYELEMQGFSISDMTSKIENAQRLREVLGAVTVFQQLLKDEILASEGAGWETATATYSTLRRAAKNRTELRLELSPVEEWFRVSQRGAKSSTPSDKAATSTADANASSTLAPAPVATSKANGAAVTAPAPTA